MIHKHFKTKAKFNEELAASRISESDICFIKNTGEIWTHGVFYAKVEASETNGNIKINGSETTVYTHPGTGTNPHGTTKSDVGLGNVTNDSQVKRSEMGTANGVATLTSEGKVPTTQLYNTLEGYGITDAYTKDEIDAQEQVVALALNDFEGQSETIANALVDLGCGKISTSDIMTSEEATTLFNSIFR